MEWLVEVETWQNNSSSLWLDPGDQPGDPGLSPAASAAPKKSRKPRPTPSNAVELRGEPSSCGARFVAIAGNIGAGKSTMTKLLADSFGIEPFYEPNDNNPYLKDFYADMRQYGFHSQMYFLSAKFRAHLELGKLLVAEPRKVFVQDRTIYEDAEIFARTLHTTGIMSERDFATYQSMYCAIRDSLPKPDLLIYLRCSLKGLHNRIAKRGRPEEQAIDPKYLKSLQDSYDAWFERYDLGPTLVIETDRLDYLRNWVDRAELEGALAQIVARS